MIYTPPTPQEVREIISALGNLSAAKAAALVGLNGGRAIRKFLAGEHKMSFAVLYTLISRGAGVSVKPESWRSFLGIRIRCGEALGNGTQA
jgi:hypothetical protein